MLIPEKLNFWKSSVLSWSEMMCPELWRENSSWCKCTARNTSVLVFNSKSTDTTRCAKKGHPSYKTAAQTLSLLVKGEGEKHMYWLHLDCEVSILREPESRPGHPSSHSFKSTSRQYPSAETMIASLIFGNSLNLSNPWFWNISSSSTKPTQTYILWQWY